MVEVKELTSEPRVEPVPAVNPPAPARRRRRWGRRVLVVALVAAAAAGAYVFAAPKLDEALNTVSTDDAYVNGHVTYVAPRVSGQVARVLVEDNMRVKKGDVLVEIDKEPYRAQVAIKKAAVAGAEADLAAARAKVRGQMAEAQANRFKLERAVEDVGNQVANLGAGVATLRSKRASLDLARANLARAKKLAPGGSISIEELDVLRQTVKVNEAAVDQALQAVYATRVGLGLPARPAAGDDLAAVPRDLDQNFSAVRQALASLVQSGSQLGYFPKRWDATPKQTLAEFYKQDPDGDVNRIFDRIIPTAPALKQAEAKLLEARRDLEKAELDLKYCDVVSEIDGVVTRRNVNPGNTVQAGQSLMMVRSLTEIWIDANFKETQLADLRIGQRVRVEVDMYGSRKEFEGRITGFTMGTGQTLDLLPPQNATGNFVKIVQRLPVRIELTDYDPDKDSLFVGLSVTPYVYYKELPTGPDAGAKLRAYAARPSQDPKPTR